MQGAQHAIQGTQVVPHLEVFTSLAGDSQIAVSCVCPLGADHSYADGLKYLGRVDAPQQALATRSVGN